MTGITTRLDGWASSLTKLGTQFDKLKSYIFVESSILTVAQCSTLYHHNALAAKICDIYPEDALREGVCVKDGAGKELDKVKSRLTELDAVRGLTDAAVWGGVYGWGASYINVEDGLTQDQPLDPKRVRKVNFLRVCDRRDLSVATWYDDPLSPKFNTPQTYTFVQASAASAETLPAGTRIHESRFIAFGGVRTGGRERRKNGGWPHSKLQRVHEQLLRVGVSWDNAAQLLQVVSQTVMKVHGLQEAITSEKGAEALEKRAQLVDMARGITRSLWIDADGEEVQNLSTSIAGVPDLLDRFGSMLAASTGIPVTKLFGTQPTGLGATGAADERSWNNRVESYRLQEMAPAVDMLASCLVSELGLTDDVVVTFPSLDRPTDAETADIRLKVAQADQIYTTIQAVLPEEIATSRFGGPAWSMDTELKPGPRDELEFPAAPGTPTHEEQPALTEAKSKGKPPGAFGKGAERADHLRSTSGAFSSGVDLKHNDEEHDEYNAARAAFKANPCRETFDRLRRAERKLARGAV